MCKHKNTDNTFRFMSDFETSLRLFTTRGCDVKLFIGCCLIPCLRLTVLRLFSQVACTEYYMVYLLLPGKLRVTKRYVNSLYPFDVIRKYGSFCTKD
jgi:hypothetical protein